MNKRDRNILQRIFEEGAAIAKMIVNIDEAAFLSNEEKMRAVCMTLINIGELVKNLSDESRMNYKQIPWKDIAGFRDVAAHGYFTLRMEDVWIYASLELPAITGNIIGILDNAFEEAE